MPRTADQVTDAVRLQSAERSGPVAGPPGPGGQERSPGTARSFAR
jgi:hypothetical protein